MSEYELLQEAVVGGNEEAIKFLLENGVDPNKSNPESVLFQSVQSPAVLRILLDYGLDPNIQSNHGETALHHFYEYPDCLKILLERGADPNIPNGVDHTPIFYVHSLDCIKLLVEAGADVNHVSRFNATPLSWAVYFDTLDVVEYLLEVGANFPYGGFNVNIDKMRNYENQGVLFKFLWLMAKYKKLDDLKIVYHTTTTSCRIVDAIESVRWKESLVLLLGKSRLLPPDLVRYFSSYFI